MDVYHEDSEIASTNLLAVVEDTMRQTRRRRSSSDKKKGAVDERRKLAVKALAEYQSWKHLYEVPRRMRTPKRQP